MWSEYHPQREAEAAMKKAADAEGAERQRLIQLALVWQLLAREPVGRSEPERNA
jgi:hypothetical protein